MPKCSGAAEQPVEEVVTILHALADPTRLAVVERLSVRPGSATELARPFAMTLPSFVQHLGVLERAGIVRSHKTGRTRIYQLVPEALRSATTWLQSVGSHWERRLDQLDQLLTDTTDPPFPEEHP
jgi:DNA-binding transcriptional ArsR family regulator